MSCRMSKSKTNSQTSATDLALIRFADISQALGALLSPALILAMVLGPFSAARAQDAAEDEPVLLARAPRQVDPERVGDGEPKDAPRRETIRYLGASGIWFRGDVARKLLGDVKALEKYKERVVLLEWKLSVYNDVIAAQKTLTQIDADIEASRLDQVGELSSALADAQDDADAWHRSRGLWFAVGVIVTGVIVSVTKFAGG